MSDARKTALIIGAGRGVGHGACASRPIRALNVLDDFNREGLGIDVGLSLPVERVVHSLNQTIEWRGKPQVIRVDNGPEYISGKLNAWAEKAGIHIQYIQPGKPNRTPISRVAIALFATNGPSCLIN